MAAERPPDGGGSGSAAGGASAGGGDGGRAARSTAEADLLEVEETHFCGSSNPAALIRSPANPEQSQCWTTSFGGDIL